MDDTETATGAKKSVPAVDRTKLGKEEGEKLLQWLRQLEESSNGFLQLSKSDVVNFLIREHKAELSNREMQQMRSHHYDPIRHLNWITPRLKDALQKNDTAAVAQLQEEIKGIELSSRSQANEQYSSDEISESNSFKRPRRQRVKRSDVNIPLIEISTKDL